MQQQQDERLRQREADERGWRPSKPRTEKAAYEKATAEQIESTPNGTLAHRNYLCQALKGERTKHAPAKMVHKADAQATGNLAFERGLMPSIAHKVPPPSKEATFEWVKYPRGGVWAGKPPTKTTYS